MRCGRDLCLFFLMEFTRELYRYEQSGPFPRCLKNFIMNADTWSAIPFALLFTSVLSMCE